MTSLLACSFPAWGVGLRMTCPLLHAKRYNEDTVVDPGCADRPAQSDLAPDCAITRAVTSASFFRNVANSAGVLRAAKMPYQLALS